VEIEGNGPPHCLRQVNAYTQELCIYRHVVQCLTISLIMRLSNSMNDHQEEDNHSSQILPNSFKHLNLLKSYSDTNNNNNTKMIVASLAYNVQICLHINSAHCLIHIKLLMLLSKDAIAKYNITTQNHIIAIRHYATYIYTILSGLLITLLHTLAYSQKF